MSGTIQNKHSPCCHKRCMTYDIFDELILIGEYPMVVEVLVDQYFSEAVIPGYGHVM